MEKICAIHQPNFFPWLGYFDKIKTADFFVFLDDVQIIKKGSSYTNRASFNIGGISKYCTASIDRQPGLTLINESIYKTDNWRDKFIKTLQMNYGKSINFKKYNEAIFNIIRYKENNIAKYNINAIKSICDILGYNTEDKFYLSSELDVKGSSTERLINICKKVGADIYLSGEGGKNYQEDCLYQENGIKLRYQNFKHPEYKQRKNDLINGLSVIDYIFEAL